MMREMVGHVMTRIRELSYTVDPEVKTEVDGAKSVVTRADREAQRIYVEAIRRFAPRFGIVAEEENLRVPCQIPGHDICFFIDPLDGTKDFSRGNLHGVSTMIALVADGEIIAAYVGDVGTQEIFGYSPGSNLVEHLFDGRFVQYLPGRFSTGLPCDISVILPAAKRGPKQQKLRDQKVLLRRSLADCSFFIRVLLAESEGFFGDLEFGRGSIGVSFAKLWKREVGAIILRPHQQPPWDSAPIVGISKKLGFKFFEVDSGNGKFVPFDFPISQKIFTTTHEILVAHGSRVEELEEATDFLPDDYFSG